MSIDTVLLRAVCRCKFKRHGHDEWEYGVAVLTSPASYTCVAIIPDTALRGEDTLRVVNEYELLPAYGCITFPIGVE